MSSISSHENEIQNTLSDENPERTHIPEPNTRSLEHNEEDNSPGFFEKICAKIIMGLLYIVGFGAMIHE